MVNYLFQRYEEELTKLENERGVDVKFLHLTVCVQYSLHVVILMVQYTLYTILIAIFCHQNSRHSIKEENVYQHNTDGTSRPSNLCYCKIKRRKKRTAMVYTLQLISTKR